MYFYQKENVSCHLIKKRSPTAVFWINFVKFFRTNFLLNTSERLLLLEKLLDLGKHKFWFCVKPGADIISKQPFVDRSISFFRVHRQLLTVYASGIEEWCYGALFSLRNLRKAACGQNANGLWVRAPCTSGDLLLECWKWEHCEIFKWVSPLNSA